MGRLLNISSIQQKLKPLSTKFKCFVDLVLSVMLYLELQEGKMCMSNKSHLKQFGATASCII